MDEPRAAAAMCREGVCRNRVADCLRIAQQSGGMKIGTALDSVEPSLATGWYGALGAKFSMIFNSHSMKAISTPPRSLPHFLALGGVLAAILNAAGA